MKTKRFVLIAMLFLSLVANAQYSIGGGFSTLFQFGNGRPFVGMNLIAEFPRNNDVTFFVRANYLFKQTKVEPYNFFAYSSNPSVNPVSVNGQFRESLNFVMIDAGTRYYIINGYDEGFSLYGGTTIGVVINSVKWNSVGEYDQAVYKLDERDQGKGTILNLAAGVTGGAKYTLPGRGTFFTEFSPSYMILAQGTKDIQTSLYQRVLFNFNIGFRKEFY